MKNVSLKILAMLMAIMMVLVVSSLVVFAEDTEAEQPEVTVANEETEATVANEETEATVNNNEETTEEKEVEETTEKEITTTGEGTEEVTTTGSDDETKKTNWFTEHLTFVIAVGIVATLVIAYFVARLVSVKFREKSTNFWKDYRTQFKKLVWPSKEQFWKNAAVVFAAIIIFGLLLAFLDWGISKLVYLLKDLMDLILPAGR